MIESYKSNPAFWENLDQIIQSHQIVIDRPVGSRHPRYPDFVYPLNYGYLQNTKSTDGMELDVWVGTLEHHKVTGLLIITDLVKMDTEQKVLYACTGKEMEVIYSISNQHKMNALLLVRDKVML